MSLWLLLTFFSSFSLFQIKPFFLRLVLFDWLFLGLWVLQLPTVHAECLEYGQKTLQTRKNCQIAYFYNIIFKQDNHRTFNHLTYNIQDTDAKNEMLRIYLKVHLFPMHHDVFVLIDREFLNLFLPNVCFSYWKIYCWQEIFTGDDKK